MVDSLNSSQLVADLSTVCGGSYDGVNQTIGQVQSFVVELWNYITDLVNLLECDNIVPVYQDTFYDASCSESLRAMIWLFSASFIVATFGFLMITFRAAYSVTIDDDIPVVCSVATDRNEIHNDESYNHRQNGANEIQDYDEARDNSTSFQDERNDLDPSEEPTEGKDNTQNELINNNETRTDYNNHNDASSFDDWIPVESKVVGDEFDKILQQIKLHDDEQQ